MNAIEQLLHERRPAVDDRRKLDVIRRGPTIGAEIRGVDWTNAIDQGVAKQIHDALMEHKIIYFQGVDISPRQQLEFGRMFGECTVHPFVPHLEDVPEVVVLDNHKDNPVFSRRRFRNINSVCIGRSARWRSGTTVPRSIMPPTITIPRGAPCTASR